MSTKKTTCEFAVHFKQKNISYLTLNAYRTENPRAVCMLVRPVFIPPYLHLHLQHMRMVAHLPAGIFYCILPRGLIGAP